MEHSTQHHACTTVQSTSGIKLNKTLYKHFSRWIINAPRMFNSSAWLVNLWSSLACNDYVTTLSEIKQVVREWAQFSYKAMFTCSFLSGRFLKIIIIVGPSLTYSDLDVQIN